LDRATRRGCQFNTPFVPSAIAVGLYEVHVLHDPDETLTGFQHQLIIQFCDIAGRTEITVFILEFNAEDAPLITVQAH